MSVNTEDSKPGGTEGADGFRQDGAPEPPVRYIPQEHPKTGVDEAAGDEAQVMNALNVEFASTLKFARIAQIMALVSLVIGGVLLSTAAVIVSVIAYRNASSLVAGDGLDVDMRALDALKRTAEVAIAMSVLALGMNVIVLAMIYPAILEMLQTGDYASLLGGAQPDSSNSTDVGSSFWG